MSLRAPQLPHECPPLSTRAQAGKHNEKRESYGHSLIIDPWGRKVAELDGTETGIAVADIHLAMLADVRTRMPVAEHRALGRPAVLRGGAVQRG